MPRTFGGSCSTPLAQYRESFDVYGTKKSFEWSLVENEPHVIHTAKKPEPEIATKVEVPDYAHLLPEPIRMFTKSIQDADHLSFIQGGGHGGSQPALGQRVRIGTSRESRSMAQRDAICQLDLRRHLCSSVDRKRRRDRSPA